MIADFVQRLAELSSAPQKFDYALQLELLSPHGRSFTIDTWKVIAEVAPQLLPYAKAWFRHHGQHLPLHIWRDFVGMEICIDNYPFTADDIKTLPDYTSARVVDSLYMNHNLRASAARLVIQLYASHYPHSSYQLQWRVYQRHWRELDPSTQEMRFAFDWANHERSHDGFPIEVVDRYLGDQRHNTYSVNCASRSITVDDILQRRHVNWSYRSFIKRDDYTLAQHAEFMERFCSKPRVPERQVVAANCRASIDELCAYQQAGETQTSCLVMHNRHHNIGDRYRHLRDKHPDDLRYVLALYGRITIDEYRRIIAIDPTEQKLLREQLKYGADRLAVGICKLPEIMYLEMRELDVARVFAMTVFMCDELLSLQSTVLLC